MIEKMGNLPQNMVGFRATGLVTKEDFERIVIPEVENIVRQTGKLNYMLVLDTNVKDFTPGAWMQDALLGLKNLTKWNRAAIVTDDTAIHQFTTVFSALMPGEFKGFKKIDMDIAVNWVSEKSNQTEAK
jgi:hypothetical protein